MLYDKDFLDYLNENERGDDRGWQIKSVIRVERKRQIADTLEHKVHSYISSLPAQDASLLAECIRSHWGIENGAHWILDVTFREDHSFKPVSRPLKLKSQMRSPYRATCDE